MGNSVLKSFIFLSLSIVLTSFILFLIGGIYSTNIFYHTFVYTFRELIFFIILLSQLIYSIVVQDKLSSRIVIISLFYWVVFLFIVWIIPNIDYTTLTRDIKNELFIQREYIAPSLDILSMQFIVDIVNKFIAWEKISINTVSSGILFLCHFSLQNLFIKISSNNTLLKSIIFVLFILFILYFWNSSYNLSLFILSIIFLKIKESHSENN